MKNLKACHVMSVPVVCSLEETSLNEILKKMLKRKISAMPIVTPGLRLIGVISKKDILLHLHRGENLENLESGNIVDRNIVTADISASISAIIRHFVLEEIHHIPITENEKLVGIITPHDILKSLPNKSPSQFFTVTKKQEFTA